MAKIELLRLTKKQGVSTNRVLNRAIELSVALKSVVGMTPQDKKMVISQLKATSRSIQEFINEQK